MYLPTRRFFFFLRVEEEVLSKKKRGGQENVQVGERPGLVRPQLRGFIVSVRHTSRMLPRKEAFVFFFALALFACFAAHHAEARVEARVEARAEARSFAGSFSKGSARMETSTNRRV